MIRGDAAEAALFDARRGPRRGRGIESDADLGPLLDNPPRRHRCRHPQAAAPHVRGRRLGAARIGDRRPAGRSALAVRVGRRHDRAARRRCISALGVTSAADLRAAVREQRVRAVPGLDAGDRGGDRRGAARRCARAIPRIPLGRAIGARRADPRAAARRCPACDGRCRSDRSAADRTRSATSRSSRPPTTRPRRSRRSSALPDVARVLHRSERRLYLLIDRVQVGVRLPGARRRRRRAAVPDRVAPLISTALRAHRRRARMDARRRTACHAPTDRAPPAATEDEIYAALGLPFIPPEIRNGDDEIAAAARRHAARARLARRHPRRSAHALVVERRPRLDRSDGRGVPRARLRVHRDHRSLAALGGVAQPDDRRRRSGRPKRSPRLRERYPDIAILHGCEVDILPDGRLDFPDRVLERSTSCWRRCTSAPASRPSSCCGGTSRRMRHPLVAVITHPTNRLVPHRRGYDLDYDRLFATAVETGTIVEIDGVAGAPRPGRRARAARDRRRRHCRRSTATATAPSCSTGRWSSASSRRGAAGSSRATSSTRGRSTTSVP